MKKKARAWIYLFRRVADGAVVYVGFSVNPEKRWRARYREPLQTLIRKGRVAPELLEALSHPGNAWDRERYHIRRFHAAGAPLLNRTHNPRWGDPSLRRTEEVITSPKRVAQEQHRRLMAKLERGRRNERTRRRSPCRRAGPPAAGTARGRRRT